MGELPFFGDLPSSSSELAERFCTCQIRKKEEEITFDAAIGTTTQKKFGWEASTGEVIEEDYSVGYIF